MKPNNKVPVDSEPAMLDDLPPGLHLHFDTFSGIAGDMTVAALVDAGVPEKIVRDAVDAMKLPGLTIAFRDRRTHSLVGKSFCVTSGKDETRVSAHEKDHPQVPTGTIVSPGGSIGDSDGMAHDGHAHGHRDYGEIREMLNRAELPPETRELAHKIFQVLACAEAKIHGVDVDRVTFHEVGADDSIADIVGMAAALTFLAPASISASPPVLGTGLVETAHGWLPVPAPATVELLRGLPVGTGGEGELTTPTGAALLATVAERFGPPPDMKIVSQGFGVGDHPLADRPNALRVLLGAPLLGGGIHD